jgi:hypothetical protein
MPTTRNAVLVQAAAAGVVVLLSVLIVRLIERRDT